MGHDLKNIEARLPPGFQQILLQLSIQILRNRPYNIYQFCANYFDGELDRRTLMEMTIENYMTKAPEKSEGLRDTSHHVLQDDSAELHRPKAHSLNIEADVGYVELKGIEVRVEQCNSKEEETTETNLTEQQVAKEDEDQDAGAPTETKEDEEQKPLDQEAEVEPGVQLMEAGTQTTVLAVDGLTQTEDGLTGVADSAVTSPQEQDNKAPVVDTPAIDNDVNADSAKQWEAEQDPDQIKGQLVEETQEPNNDLQVVEVQQEQEQTEPEKQEKEEPEKKEREDEELIRQRHEQEQQELKAKELLQQQQEQLEQEELIQQAEQLKQQNKDGDNTSNPPVEDHPQPSEEVESIPQSPPTPTPATDATNQELVPDELREDLPRANSPEPHLQYKFPTDDEKVAQYRAIDPILIGPEDGFDTSDMEMVSTREDSLESVKATAKPPAVARPLDKFPLYEAAIYDSLYEKEYPVPTWRPYSVNGSIPPMQAGVKPSTLPPSKEASDREPVTSLATADTGDEPGNATKSSQPSERAGDEVKEPCVEAEKTEGAEGGLPPVSEGDVDIGWVENNQPLEGTSDVADDKQPPESEVDVDKKRQGAEGNKPPESGGDVAEKMEGAEGGEKPPESGGDVAEKVEGAEGGEKPSESRADVAEIAVCNDADCQFAKGHDCPCQPLDLSQVMEAEIGQHNSEELLARVIRQAMYRVDMTDVSPEPSTANANRWSV